MRLELLLRVHELGTNDEPNVLVLCRQQLASIAIGCMLCDMGVQGLECF